MADRQTTRRRVLKHFAIGATSAGALTGHAAAHDDEGDASTGDDGNDSTSETGAGGGGSNGATGRVVLTFDHISPSIFDTAAPILREYDYPALLAVVTNRVSSGELAQLQQLRSMGWEIGSHSMRGHPHFTGLSTDQLVQQARGSKEWLTNNGFARNGGSIVYPYGSADSRVADVVREYFSVGFYGGSSTADTLLIDRVNGDNVAQTKQAIANAANGGGTVTIMYHTVGANDGRVTTSGFRETMEYIAGRDVQVVPASALGGGTQNDGGSTGGDDSHGNDGSTDDGGSTGDDDPDGDDGSTDDGGSGGGDSESNDDDGHSHDNGGNDGDGSGSGDGSGGDSGSDGDSNGNSGSSDGSDDNSGSSDGSDGNSGSSGDSDGHTHDHGGSGSSDGGGSSSDSGSGSTDGGNNSSDGGGSSTDGGSGSTDGGSSSTDGHSHDHGGSGSSGGGSSSGGHSH